MTRKVFPLLILLLAALCKLVLAEDILERPVNFINESGIEGVIQLEKGHRKQTSTVAKGGTSVLLALLRQISNFVPLGINEGLDAFSAFPEGAKVLIMPFEEKPSVI